MKKKLGRNRPCPCGSGKKYKNCCWNKGLNWVRDSEGQIRKEIPISSELGQEFERYSAKFKEEQGGDFRTNEYIFPQSERVQMEAETISIMKHAGVHPALLYAYEKTGRIVTEQNKRFLSTQELKEWDDAVDEYYYQHHEGRDNIIIKGAIFPDLRVEQE